MQLTLAITAVVALVVALAGLAIVLFADHRDRADVDQALAARAAQVRTTAAKTGKLATDGSFAVRLVQGTNVRAQIGSTTKFSAPVKDGYTTVTAEDGSHWRSWAEKLKTGVQMQVLISLEEVESRHDGNVRMIDLIVLLAAVVAAAGTWLVGGLVLRPLRQLAQGAREIDPDDAGTRLPAVTGPPEVAELGESLNGAIDRLHERVDTLSRTGATAVDDELAGDLVKAVAELRFPLAELGEGLDQLLDNPEMPATQRHLYLASIQTEYRRIVTLVDELEARAASR
ncbi:HAMP domain-containing protein [Actinoplanes sp. KI2]|uniref:HAMP domain-containing protein n=1 Tax=Actinoplanes sp. KI2 TaxID=2983315 RepID=UPI0021D5E589|nr:HAMP domain-containing protein [Actinoplanes sp. KI2]MCU7723094.1 HAMP domain-containing protein [Actinoplanes sp. KI2]